MVFSNLRAPISSQYELTRSCNNHCNYCYNYWKSVSKECSFKELTEKESEVVVRKVGESEIFDFLFTGGEPLLRKKLLFKLIPMAGEYNMSVSINSNLRGCSDDDARRLKDLGVSSIISSLVSHIPSVHNSITGSEDSFLETLRGIKAVVRTGNKLSINMVVTQENKEHVYKTGKFLYENFGVTKFMATPISPPSKNQTHLELSHEEIIRTLDDLLLLEKDLGISCDVLEPIPYCLINELKYHKFMLRSCTAGSTTVTIGANGDVRPCSHSSKVYGNLLEEDLKQIWNRMVEWRDGSLIPIECLSCTEKIKCSGCCRVHAEIKFGNLNGRDPWMKKPIRKKIEKRIRADVFDTHSKYSISPMVRVRRENDKKYCVSPRPGVLIVVDENLLNLIKLLVKESRSGLISPKELSIKYKLDERYLNSLLQLLYVNKFLERQNG